MKLTDIYPGITKRDFEIDISKADVVIEDDEYKLARIFRKADEKFPDFSYNVIFPRKRNQRSVSIDDFVFVSDDFVENPVDWRIHSDMDDTIKNNILEREYSYCITRNGSMFMGWFSSRNSAETILEMIKRHPFDFNMYDWEELITRYPVRFLGFPAKIKYVLQHKGSSCTLDFSDYGVTDKLISLPDKIKILTETAKEYTGIDELFRNIIFDIDCNDFYREKLIHMSILNPYISWKDEDKWTNIKM